jgi:NTE family protein
MAALLRKVADPDSTGEGANWAKMRIHRVESESIMLQLGYSSKMLAEWAFFCMLRDEGRKAAEQFLSTYGDDIGVRSTLDIDFLLTEV